MVSEREKYEPIARNAARAAGIDPDLFVRQINQESGWDSDVIHCRRLSSASAAGIAQIVARFHPGVNPCEPVAALEYAAGLMRSHLATWDGDYALALSSYNAGPGATRDGVNGNLPGWPYAETVAYVSNILQVPADEARRRLTKRAPPIAPTLTYNPSQPPERQIADWVCSIRATSWILKSMGLPVDIGALQDEMSPRYVTPEKGLLDARGYGIAETIRAHLPIEWHPRVHVFEAISWDELRSLAGRGPIAVGLRGAYHWLNVAKPLPDGTLAAPNPAPNWHNLGDTLTREEFDAWGPASAVWVNAETATAPAPPTPPLADPRDAEIAALRKQIAERDNLIGYLTGDKETDVFGALDRALVKARAAADTLRRHAP